MSIRVNKDSFETEVLKSETLVIADFYSDSCVPCKRLSPVLADIEEAYADSVKVVKININFEPQLVEKYEVQAAPTLIFFKNGSAEGSLRGVAKKDDIIAIIDKLK